MQGKLCAGLPEAVRDKGFMARKDTRVRVYEYEGGIPYSYTYFYTQLHTPVPPW